MTYLKEPLYEWHVMLHLTRRKNKTKQNKTKKSDQNKQMNSQTNERICTYRR